MTAALALTLLLAAAVPSERGPALAERLAERGRATLAGDPEKALALAQEALRASAEFVPTDFVKPGRKGEVVEDAFLQGRQDYRAHRAPLYRLAGECLLGLGRGAAAARYLRRAQLLDPGAGALPSLLRALLAGGREAEAFERAMGVLVAGRGTPELTALAEQAADAVGLASVQAELDRRRFMALPAEARPRLLEAPISAPQRARLSTGQPLRFDEPGLTLLYVADAACRSCSADLEALARLKSSGARIMVAGADPDRDQALRQALGLYGHNWPFVSGARWEPLLGAEFPVVLVVGRQACSAAVVGAPLAERLARVLPVFQSQDLQEKLPRPAWSRRPVPLPPAPPGLLPEGLAPGEDEPAPTEFPSFADDFRARRFAPALARLEALQADGWLLAPEARLNRALCLIGLGRRQEARHLLLRLGDSRFQERVDEALEEASRAR